MDVYLFNNQKQLIEILKADDITINEQTQNLKGLITHILSGRYNPQLDKADYFGIKDVEDTNLFWRYKIQRLSKENRMFTLDGIHEFFDDLKTKTYIKDKRPQNKTAQEALTMLLEGTGWKVGTVTSQHIASTNWYYISPLEAFWDFVEKWNVEFKFNMTYSNGKVVSKTVDIADQLSKFRGKIYEYGDKLVSIVEEAPRENIYTAFIGRGRGVEVVDETTGEPTGGYGRRLTFEDVIWSTLKGDPLDKPQGQEYLEFSWATKAFGFEDGTPRFAPALEFDIDDPENLLIETYNAALDMVRPKVHLQTTVVETAKVELGETVSVLRPDMRIKYQTRIFKIVRNFKNKKIKTLEFGDKLTKTAVQKLQHTLKKTKKATIKGDIEIAGNLEIGGQVTKSGVPTSIGGIGDSSSQPLLIDRILLSQLFSHNNYVTHTNTSDTITAITDAAITGVYYFDGSTSVGVILRSDGKATMLGGNGTSWPKSTDYFNWIDNGISTVGDGSQWRSLTLDGYVEGATPDDFIQTKITLRGQVETTGSLRVYNFYILGPAEYSNGGSALIKRSRHIE